MTEPFSIRDRRASAAPSSRTGGLYTGNADAEMRRLRSRGFTLPQSNFQARIEAKKVVTDVRERGTVTDVQNRAMAAAMRQERTQRASSRIAGSTMTRTGANTQMVLPKVRQPLSSLMDKGIPFNVEDPKELVELRRWCRLFYSTHHLVPLLVDIYSKFPVTGLEFVCKDPKIEQFYESMFMDDLNYEEFLPDGLLREYFMVGEVSALAHFNEQLGIWSSEEILNPDMVRVSKSLFVEQERVQLLVKDLVESLRSGPMGMSPSEESPSEKYERNFEYCCTPEARVLTATMEWVPVRSLRLGDKIVGFDEFAPKDNPPGSRGHGRCYRETEVTATSIIRAPVFDVVTDGPRVTCTGEHMWLVAKRRNGRLGRPPLTDQENRGLSAGLQWVKTKDLLPGDRIRYLGEWDYEDNADVGYVAGIFDGEGHFSDGTLAFAQHPGPVLDKAVEILRRYKFDLRISAATGGCYQVRIRGGIPEMARAVGTFRPIRLMPKFYEWLDGRTMSGSRFKPVVVQSVTPAGIADVVALATSTKTLVVEGLFSHNTQLTQHYPEIIQAAMRDDGLDISDALVSRMVNKAAWWDLRGTPHLLRSFRTLMLEESLNAAQDAVCDRLYAPLILATLGIEGAMGDGEPWLPDQGELEDLRDDIQSALAADFKLLVHNFGLTVTSVFGRESVPRFDTDYDRVDANLMQSWGIGQALIMGGTGGGGTYASSAINREVCEQLMMSAQKKAIRHMRKRMEVIAEAQEHYDFELKGGVRTPIYREIVQYNEETGEEEIVRVPKLLIPDVKFATLNLRDEATERAFVSQLKQLGVPISDKTLAINIPFEFDQELERQGQETIDKGMAQSESMHVLQQMLDEKGWAYPAELAQFLSATLEVRASLAQTEAAETQNKMLDQQMAQTSPAGMMGLLPGTTMQPLAGSGVGGAVGQPAPGDPAGAPPPAEQASDAQPGATADPTLGAGAPMVADPSQQMTATMHGPRMMPPGGPVDTPTMDDATPEVARNRQRPEESDEQRAGMPGKVGKANKRSTALPGRGEPDNPILSKDAREQLNTLTKMTRGPSSYRKSRTGDERRIERAVRRREVLARGGASVDELVHDPEFYAVCHGDAYQGQLMADWPEIQAGGAPESAKILQELVEQYEEITGLPVRW
jgi:hypothetical protein